MKKGIEIIIQENKIEQYLESEFKKGIYLT
jgi:hypothetical protein